MLSSNSHPPSLRAHVVANVAILITTYLSECLCLRIYIN